MPQLPSGRHVGLCIDRLMEWARVQASAPELLEFLSASSDPQALLALVDVTLYSSQPTEDGEGDAQLTGFTAAQVETEADDWSGDDIAAFQAWLQQPRTLAWLETVREDVGDLIPTKPLPATLRGSVEG